MKLSLAPQVLKDRADVVYKSTWMPITDVRIDNTNENKEYMEEMVKFLLYTLEGTKLEINDIKIYGGGLSFNLITNIEIIEFTLNYMTNHQIEISPLFINKNPFCFNPNDYFPLQDLQTYFLTF